MRVQILDRQLVAADDDERILGGRIVQRSIEPGFQAAPFSKMMRACDSWATSCGVG